jgi:hypothetical protein
LIPVIGSLSIRPTCFRVVGILRVGVSWSGFGAESLAGWLGDARLGGFRLLVSASLCHPASLSPGDITRVSVSWSGPITKLSNNYAGTIIALGKFGTVIDGIIIATRSIFQLKGLSNNIIGIIIALVFFSVIKEYSANAIRS